MQLKTAADAPCPSGSRAILHLLRSLATLRIGLSECLLVVATKSQPIGGNEREQNGMCGEDVPTAQRQLMARL